MAQHFLESDTYSSTYLANNNMDSPLTWEKSDKSLLSYGQDLVQGYRSLLISQFDFFRIKAREDAENLVRKNTYIVLALLLFLFSWLGLMVFAAILLERVMPLSMAVLSVSSVHLVAALVALYSFKKTRAIKTIPIKQEEAEKFLDNLEGSEEKREGAQALHALKASENQINDARMGLEEAVKEKLSPARIISRKPFAAVATALTFGILFGLTTSRKN